MKIKNKFLQHLAISLEFARIRVIWIAETILLALGVIGITEPDVTGEPYTLITGSLIWLIWVKRRESSIIWLYYRECQSRRYKCFIRPP